jgi:hypothetical protein
MLKGNSRGTRNLKLRRRLKALTGFRLPTVKFSGKEELAKAALLGGRGGLNGDEPNGRLRRWLGQRLPSVSQWRVEAVRSAFAATSAFSYEADIANFQESLGDTADSPGPVFRPMTNDQRRYLHGPLDPDSVYQNIVRKYGLET